MIDMQDIGEGDDMATAIRVGQFVDGKIYKFSPLGANIKLPEEREGLLYKQEIRDGMRVGDTIKVYIKNIREDGKIDLSLEKGGYKNYIETATDTIINALKEAGGTLPFTDKSTPEEIQQKFNLSKSRFKDAIGALYRERKITITDEGIKLVE